MASRVSVYLVGQRGSRSFTDSPSLARVVEIKAGFAIQDGSPALDAGVDVVGEGDHPNWHPGQTDRRWDYEGDPRADGGSWDLGVDER